MHLFSQLYLDTHNSGNLGHVLVTASTHVDDKVLSWSELLGQLDSIVNGVTCLEGRDDTLVLAHHLEALKGLAVGNGSVLGAANVLQICVLGANARIIETSTDGVSVESLSALLLDNVGHGTLQYTLGSLAEGSAVLLVDLKSMSSSLDTVQLNSLILHEGVEGTDGVRSATDAGHDGIGELPGLLQHLRSHL